MLKHVLMFRLKNKSNGAGKTAKAQQLKTALEAMKEQIPEIQFLEVGLNVSESPASYDLLLYTEFEDTEALERYRNHPEHQKILNLIHQLCSEKIVLDYWS